MTGEAATTGRPLLPQTAHMSNFGFVPQAAVPRENQKTFVFVNEQNRHKRLKVMRACEGCRRRKIKCDAATTNQWPCAACVRLKLNCVPPTINYEKDGSGLDTLVFDLDPTGDYDDPTSTPTSLQRQTSFDQQHGTAALAYGAAAPPYMYTGDGSRIMQSNQYLPTTTAYNTQTYGGITAHAVPVSQAAFQQPMLYTESMPTAPRLRMPEEDGPWSSASAQSQSDMNNAIHALGELRINDTAVAPYIANQNTPRANLPAVEEPEIQLPTELSPDHTVRIPVEMMPSEHEAMAYFTTFFSEIHSYIPVLDRNYFYQQWHNDRGSISPLILEGIFACASRMMIEDISVSNKWLALAAKHEEHFKDVPRLSTLQGMLLIMKAREAQVKRGYYYRSWLTIVNLVAMAKDIRLQDHLEVHQSNRPCGSSTHDCNIKYRVWHCLFQLELMIGGPQGRSEYSVPLESVDYEYPSPFQHFDESDHITMKHMAAVNRAIRNTRESNRMAYKLMKQNENWMFDPEFLSHGQTYLDWPNELAEELQLHIPEDGSTPMITSHQSANLHAYYHLGVIMHHRPILQNAQYHDPNWRKFMSICHSSVKKICQLQEAMLDSFSIQGLMCMARGINVAIYAAVTSISIHLVALTCPDPNFNNQSARDFFTRQMRVLEQTMNFWPMPELELQVTTFRQAFSADVNKPFELKSSFPYGSPTSHAQEPSPPLNEGNYRPHFPSRQEPLALATALPVQFQPKHPMTPPISACDTESKADSPTVQNLAVMNGQRQHPGSMPMADPNAQFSAHRIFDQWNAAFGAPGPFSPPPQEPPLSAHGQTIFAHQLAASPTAGHSHPMPGPGASQTSYPYPTPTASNAYVTPSTWQNAVAGSAKRAWHEAAGGAYASAPMVKRRA